MSFQFCHMQHLLAFLKHKLDTELVSNKTVWGAASDVVEMTNLISAREHKANTLKPAETVIDRQSERTAAKPPNHISVYCKWRALGRRPVGKGHI